MLPLAKKLPDSKIAPFSFKTKSLSPVSIASFASATPSITTASDGICSPAEILRISFITISSGVIFCSREERITVIFSLLNRLSLSIIFLARTSVAIPEIALNIITTKKIKLLQAPTSARRIAIKKFNKLKRVKTFLFTISQKLLLLSILKSLTSPCEILFRTSAAVNPLSFFSLSI